MYYKMLTDIFSEDISEVEEFIDKEAQKCGDEVDAEEIKNIAIVMFKAAQPVMLSFCDFAKNYPNKRVKHLSFFGKTDRVRTKNLKRIIKDYKKQAKKR